MYCACFQMSLCQLSKVFLTAKSNVFESYQKRRCIRFINNIISFVGPESCLWPQPARAFGWEKNIVDYKNMTIKLHVNKPSRAEDKDKALYLHLNPVSTDFLRIRKWQSETPQQVKRKIASNSRLKRLMQSERKVRDSNPRYPQWVYRISSPAHSVTLPTFLFPMQR